MLDLNLGITSGTASLTSAFNAESKWTVDSIGKAGQTTSLTITGTGDVDATAAVGGSIALSGTTASLIASGLTDADGISVHSSATLGATVTGTAAANEISGGAGNDSLTGGAGADRFGLTGRVETITIAGVTATTDTFNATINGVATATSVTAAASNDSAATGLAAAINATSATSFATASATGAVVTVTYTQYFGTPGSTAIVFDAADTNNTATVLASSPGDNAGNDTIVGNAGNDTIFGGSGNDSINAGSGADLVYGGTGADTVDLGADLDTYVVAVGESAPTESLGTVTTASSVTGFDSVTGLGRATGSALSETLDLPGTIAVPTDGTTDNTNVTVYTNSSGGNVIFKSHVVASGIVTFHNDDTPGTSTAIVVNAANLAGAIAVLKARDLGNAGATVAFKYDSDGDGTVDALMVYNQGSNTAGTDVSLVMLVGQSDVASLITTNASTANALFIS
jgi:Ca2+-binding RTX toxin-like protein